MGTSQSEGEPPSGLPPSLGSCYKSHWVSNLWVVLGRGSSIWKTALRFLGPLPEPQASPGGALGGGTQ